MKVFKTEKIIYLNDNTKYIPKIESDKILSKSIESSKDKFISVKEKSPQKFLNKKVCHFRIYKYDSVLEGQTNKPKEGKWTFKEHIQYLQALEKFGINWKEISKLIPSRTPEQIRSHSQKFYKKLKQCKDIELGIDFTSKHFKNINDMIAHIKSVNKDYDIVTLFLYLSEKCFPNKKIKKDDKVENININNILSETININNNINDSLFNNDNKENIFDKKNKYERQIINNNLNNIYVNNILINNINYFNGINDSAPLTQFYLNSLINSNCINNNIILQNNPINNMDNNYFYNNNSRIILDMNNVLSFSMNNFEFDGVTNTENNYK